MQVNVCKFEVSNLLHQLRQLKNTHQSRNHVTCDVWCDLQSGGFTVFQRRMDGSEHFYRSWADYVGGFGKHHREHWLGLEKIHCLTASKGRAELYVDMYDCDGVRKYARYSYFHVEGSSVNYKLHISGYSGTAGDSFNRGSGSHNLNGMQFSTWDRDNDRWSGASCAAYGGGLGGWWFSTCFYCNLNGPYVCGLVQRSEIGVLWQNLGSSSRSLKYTEIKMRFI